MKNVTYTMQGDYRLPDLLPTQEPEIRLGKYALLRRRYLKEHRRVTYTNLLTSGKLNDHLLEIEQTVKQRLSQIIPQMMENIARAVGIPVDRVNVKATTEEKLGFTGEGLGMSCHAVCLLEE